MMDLKGKKVLVVGLGKSGLAAALFLRHHGAQVTVSDIRSAEALAKDIPALLDEGINVEAGGHGDAPIVGIGIDELRWRKVVRPGDALRIERRHRHPVDAWQRCPPKWEIAVMNTRILSLAASLVFSVGGAALAQAPAGPGTAYPAASSAVVTRSR